jgi:flagellar protein FlbD
MIEVSKLSGEVYWLNPHMIEYMEKIPDTSVSMLSGKKLIVKDTVDEIISRIVEYRRLIGAFKNEE